ncbi:hypothetical protein COS78_02975 [Candidatus Shapirobacteria bacterium CG06_land_8_20_14_3_00_40_12]|uniref:Uncharacterized protein n=2 Tax=Candidatus Shapironibacteriota TaxID=1752721 RepID=A0A2M7TU65_9BACT|nr:MAG: hypothetical protein COS78_02975 [Candidatus Shapirobacteria bacterium CG06_land_8_20_14_3_00_40_12]PIZ61366.1 MAG: hypothetical protein COY20_00450 [Candidatus Shapirobacteria bacterium CG_4_10_14_0_2_um_filter_40_12]
MSSKKLNLLSDIYFGLILLSGFFYSIFLAVASPKLLRALTMQIIFLLDALKFSNNTLSLITSRSFLINVIPGLILLGLLSQYVKALIKSTRSVKSTRLFINTLIITKITPTFTQFRSGRGHIFTSGFFHPIIYLSLALFETHSPEEIEAMIQHEINHQKNYHPLKIFITGFIKSTLPFLPGRNWLFDNYLTLVEVSSDQFSDELLNNKLPLVSALLKFQSQSFEPGISYFNSQSERIKILVGQKKQGIKIPMAYYSIILFVFLSSTLFIKDSDLFFDCRHLLRCVEKLITSSTSQIFFQSDHCQPTLP